MHVSSEDYRNALADGKKLYLREVEGEKTIRLERSIQGEMFKGDDGVSYRQDDYFTFKPSGSLLGDVFALLDASKDELMQSMLQYRIRNELGKIMRPFAYMLKHQNNVVMSTYTPKVFVLQDLSCLDKTRENTVLVSISNSPLHEEKTKLTGYVMSTQNVEGRFIKETFDAWRFRELNLDAGDLAPYCADWLDRVNLIAKSV